MKIKIKGLNLNLDLGRVPHGIFCGDDLLLQCESIEDAQDCLTSNPAFRQMRSMGIILEIRPVKNQD